MASIDASSGRCIVLTYREGLLSALNHDLKLEVTRFNIDVDDRMHAFTATFDVLSLRAICAIKDGIEMPHALSSKDMREIEANVANEVLDAKTYREVRFHSVSVVPVAEGFFVDGRLEIKGKVRESTFHVRAVGPDWVAELSIHQPDFGIRPFSAMFGAMKVKPDVDVRVSVSRGRIG